MIHPKSHSKDNEYERTTSNSNYNYLDTTTPSVVFKQQKKNMPTNSAYMSDQARACLINHMTGADLAAPVSFEPDSRCTNTHLYFRHNSDAVGES